MPASKPANRSLSTAQPAPQVPFAVQVAKYLGARKIIVTSQNARELEELRGLGADVAIAFDLRPENPQGVGQFEQALEDELVNGLDVVIDYLWGTSARAITVAIAKAIEDAHPVRFIQVGEAAAASSNYPLPPYVPPQSRSWAAV